MAMGRGMQEERDKLALFMLEQDHIMKKKSLRNTWLRSTGSHHLSLLCSHQEDANGVRNGLAGA